MIATELQEELERYVLDEPCRVSVVVPSYNHAPFVAMTLRSIIKQWQSPAELLVIDDGSTDNSLKEIEAALKDCPFPCELIARENRGLCATLNEGLARTRGDYFGYLSSDDVWLPEFISTRVELLERRPKAVLAYGHAYFIDEQNRIIDCTADWATYVDGDARQMLLTTIGPMSPTVLYRRSALDNNRWDESSRLEDYDLYLRLSDEGDFAFDSRVLSAWRRHESNVSWDQTMMLDEQLNAQREAARRFGLTESEIEKLQTQTRFARAEDFLRLGQKTPALHLIKDNWRGANSLSATARMFLRFAIPTSFMRGRMRERQRRAHARYGTLYI
jgi:glycosyltransferase involved in cell wall biosynthesis